VEPVVRQDLAKARTRESHKKKEDDASLAFRLAPDRSRLAESRQFLAEALAQGAQPPRTDHQPRNRQNHEESRYAWFAYQNRTPRVFCPILRPAGAMPMIPRGSKNW
jgi:hypothetical protein